MQSSPKSIKEAGAKRLLIVDGHAYAYRAFFAIRRLNSPTGKATNAIYGFIRMLGKMQNLLKPSHIVVVWDGGLAKERMELLPEYKAQRVEMPADLGLQLDEIVAYLKAVGIASYVYPGVEADDCIAALTFQSVAAEIPVVIASSDKDFMQLVSPGVGLLNPNDKTESIWGDEQVKIKTGVNPIQVIDWLSLVGDTVDNIPGVPGVGPKTAADLLQKFGSIEEIYRRLNEVSSDRLRANLSAAVELVRRNQKLVRLNAEVSCDLQLADLAVGRPHYEILRDLYSGWGFRTLLQELEQEHLKTADFFQ